MPGLLNAQQGQPEQMPVESEEQMPDEEGMPDEEPKDAQDPILKQIEDGIEAAVPKELKTAYLRVMAAGMKIMFSKETSKFMEERLENVDDVPKAVAEGIADLLLLVYNESKRTMSIPAAMLAAFSLMSQALDYAEKIGKGPLDDIAYAVIAFDRSGETP